MLMQYVIFLCSSDNIKRFVSFFKLLYDYSTYSYSLLNRHLQKNTIYGDRFEISVAGRALHRHHWVMFSSHQSSPIFFGPLLNASVTRILHSLNSELHEEHIDIRCNARYRRLCDLIGLRQIRGYSLRQPCASHNYCSNSHILETENIDPC